MAKISTVRELLEFEDKQTVMAVKGKVIKVRDYHQGTNDRGPWSIQKLTIADPDGCKMEVKLSGLNPVDENAVGLMLCAAAQQDAKGQWRGCYIGIDDYKGKKTKQLCVTESGIFELQPARAQTDAPDAAPAPQPPPTPQAKAPAKAPAKQPTQAPTTAQPDDGPPVEPDPDAREPRSGKPTPEEEVAKVAHVMAFLSEQASAYFLCVQTVAGIAKIFEDAYGEDMPPEQRQAATSCLFIEGNRKGQFFGLPKLAKTKAHLDALLAKKAAKEAKEAGQ